MVQVTSKEDIFYLKDKVCGAKENVIGLMRLVILAEHLLYGKLGHDKFDFKWYDKKLECGTVGCAIGECPTVFSNEWIIEEENKPHLKNKDYYFPNCSAIEFFNITLKQYNFLFYPVASETYCFDQHEGMKRLIFSSSKEEVAENILNFVRFKLNHAQTTDNV